MKPNKTTKRYNKGTVTLKPIYLKLFTVFENAKIRIVSDKRLILVIIDGRFRDYKILVQFWPLNCVFNESNSSQIVLTNI